MKTRFIPIGIIFILSACVFLTESPASTVPAAASTQTPTARLTSTTALTELPAATSSPTSCTGWSCTLDGTVFFGSAAPGNEMPGIEVQLSQYSNCSPTRGEQQVVSGPDGGFAFDVYLHDTDSFTIQVEHEGYEPAKQMIGGFDCLFCACPPFEIILTPLQ